MKFDFKPTIFQSGWTNIFHATTGGHCCNLGQRIPAVWFHKKGSAAATNNTIQVCSAVNDVPLYCVFSNPLSRGQWATVEISQQKEGSSYKYQVKVNGATIKSVVNKKPREFLNVKIYSASPWVNAAPGVIRNLVVRSGKRLITSFSESL